MKVAFLTHYTALLGANRSLLDLVRGLEGKIEPVVLLPEPGPMQEALREMGVRAETVPMEDSVYISGFMTELKRPLRIARRRLVGRKTTAALRSLGPDIIYSNSSVLTCGISAALKLRLPHVWHIREYGKADYNLSQDLGTLGMRFYLNRSARVITISRSIDDHIRSIAPGCRTRQIYNGVVREADIGQQGRSIRDKPEITLAIVGYIHGSKGQDIAVQALSLLTGQGEKNVRLLIAGNGDEAFLRQLKSDVGKRGLQGRVEFTGYVENPQTIYDQTDILLMCSRKEAFGRVTVEAMSQGIPVIGTDAGGTPEIISHGVDGFLFDRSPEALAGFIKQLSADAAAYALMSGRALQKARKFTLEQYAGSVWQELQDLGTGP